MVCSNGEKDGMLQQESMNGFAPVGSMDGLPGWRLWIVCSNAWRVVIVCSNREYGWSAPMESIDGLVQ
jgi:hypothetical protein